MKDNSEKKEYLVLRELFSADAKIPESTERRIREVCGGLEERTVFNGSGLFGRTAAFSRRAAAAAAAALLIIIGAGTALASGAAHGKLFQTTLGQGTAGNEGGREYIDGFGEVHEFPLFERADADEAAAEALLGRYIVPVDRQVKYGDTTFSFMDFVMDENGIGYFSYTLENPAGVDGIIGRYESGSEIYIDTGKSGVPQPRIESRGPEFSPDSRTVINDSLSTGTSAYIVELFAFPCPLEQVGEFGIVCGGEKISLAKDDPVPVREMLSADGEHKIRLSPIGMTAECLSDDVYECITKELYIGDYTVISDERNINNTYYSVRWGVDRGEGEESVSCSVTGYVFNRLVQPDAVDKIELTAKHTKAEEFAEQPAPYVSNTEGLKTESENPFHFAHKDIEVFVLTRGTVENAPEEDLKAFAAFEHGAGTYEILAAKDGGIYAKFADRDYILSRYPVSPKDGMVTAREAIDEYLRLLEKYYPEYRGRVRSMALDLYEYENIPESGTRYSWRISRTDIPAEIDAETGRVISPECQSLNG